MNPSRRLVRRRNEHHVDSEWRALVFALGSGVALGASAPPTESWLAAALFAPAVMLACEPFVHTGRVGPAFRVGLAAGIGFGAVALIWVASAITRFAHSSSTIAWLGAVATILLEALAPAFACALYVASARGRTSPVLAAAAIAVAFEATPMLFPYRPIAMALPCRPLAQWLAVGGPCLGDFALALPGCLALAGARSHGATRRGHLLAAIAAVAIVLGVGGARLDTLDRETRSAARVSVGVVQPNVALATGLDRHARASRLHALREATDALAARGASIVLWPESAHPYVFERSRPDDLVPPHDTRSTPEVVVVAGALTQRGACARWNGVLAFHAGRIVARVDKERRMPFGDYVPFGGFSRRSRCRDLRPAESLAPIDAARGAGALLCYDEVEPEPARDRVRAGAGWLAGFTNDAWYDGTRQPFLHERMAQMRAVETGRDLVRAVNTGLSAHVAADGTVLTRLPSFERGTLLVRVPLRAATTPFVAFGDSFANTLAAFVTAVLGWNAYARTSQRVRTSSGGGGR